MFTTLHWGLPRAQTLNWDIAKVETRSGSEADLVGSSDEVEDVNLFWGLISIGQQGVQVGGRGSHSLSVHYVVQVPDNTLAGVTLWFQVLVLVWVFLA